MTKLTVSSCLQKSVLVVTSSTYCAGSKPPTGRPARKIKRAIKVLYNTLIARLIFLAGRPVGGFDPAQYVDEVTTNTDFCKHDDTVSFVIDCPLDCIASIQAFLEREMAAGHLRFGMNVSETALMTCIVTAPAGGLHVHFVDGGDGGYTAAAKTMKASAAKPVAA